MRTSAGCSASLMSAPTWRARPSGGSAYRKALRLDNVEVVCGDVHDLDSAALGGPFDLAYTRLFLMHQRDPGKTLSHIAGLLRPGGWVVAQEALRFPPPR